MSYPERRNGKLTGKWVAERTLSGKRVRVKLATKEAGDRWEAIVDATGKPPMDGEGAMVAHAIGAVAEHAKRRREAWKAERDPSLLQRLEEVLAYFGPLNALETITTEKLGDFVEHLRATRKGRDGGPISDKTVNRYLAVVSALLDHAEGQGWHKSPAVIPWLEEVEGRIEFLTEADEQAVAALLPDDTHRLCMKILIATGMRASEFFELSPEQIDTADNRSAWVRITADRTKGRKAASIPLAHDLARPLKALATSGELPDHRRFYLAFKNACSGAGLSDELCVHSLRHTTGTRLARRVKPAVAQDFMRHGSYKTTQKYIHLTDDDRLAASEALMGA